MACDSKPRDFREKAERSLEVTKLNKDNYFKSKPVINEKKKSVANREAVSLEDSQVLVTTKEENRPSQEEVEDMRFC